MERHEFISVAQLLANVGAKTAYVKRSSNGEGAFMAFSASGDEDDLMRNEEGEFKGRLAVTPVKKGLDDDFSSVTVCCFGSTTSSNPHDYLLCKKGGENLAVFSNAL